jgi:hypothetical protein
VTSRQLTRNGSIIERSGGRVIRKRGGSLQVQVFAGRDPLTARKRWLSRQVRGQTKAAWREAKKVEAQLLEQLDRGEQRGSRTRTVTELRLNRSGDRQLNRALHTIVLARLRDDPQTRAHAARPRSEGKRAPGIFAGA